MATELNCAKCGACAVVCPVYRSDRREVLTARGKMHLLNTTLAEHPTNTFTNLFAQCLLCGACEQVCPRHLPITDLISKARSTFSPLYGPNGLKKTIIGKVLRHPDWLEGLVKAGITLQRINALPEYSGLRLKLGLVEERAEHAQTQYTFPSQAGEEASSSSLSYFTGCFSRHLQPSLIEATQTLVQASSLFLAHIPQDQHCCGLAAWSSGNRKQACSLAQKNIQAFSSISGPILTSCASCSSHLLAYPSLFVKDDPWHAKAVAFAERVQEFTSFFAAKLPEQAFPADSPHPQQRVFYHDPCHLRYTEKGMKSPRSLLHKVGVQIIEPEDGTRCCGQGGLFHIACPEHSAQIFAQSSQQALAGSPDAVTTTCSGCLMQFHEGLARQGQQVRVVHLAVLLGDYLANGGH